MRVHLLLILLLSFLMGCGKKDPCKDLPNGIYQYPPLPKDHTMTSEEVAKFLDLPKEIAECLTTDNLIESILGYPYMSLIFAGSNSQSGYNLVKRQFRGLTELENRTDRGKCLLQKYLSRDPLGFDKSWDTIKIGTYMSIGVYLEVIQSQYINLQNLDSLDFNNMFLRSLEVYNLEKTELEYFGYFALTFCTTNVARMMQIYNYPPFITLYNSNVSVSSITNFYGPPDTSAIHIINNMAVEFSKEFKK